MLKNFTENMCPRCQAAHLKTWDELTDDQKFIFERLPLSAEFSLAERKRHRFCERCQFEEIVEKPLTA